jgi:hypothetical protein
MEIEPPGGVGSLSWPHGTRMDEEFLVRQTPGAGVNQANGGENGEFAMLVLSRKQLRSVAVGDPNGCQLMLNVAVLEIQDGSVRLGLEVNTDPHGQVRLEQRAAEQGLERSEL